MSELPQGWTSALLAEVADINPRLGIRPNEEAPVSFVGMADLDADQASSGPGTTRPYGDVSKGYTYFRREDILVAKITPCFQNNKIGQANITHEHGAGSTEFHVVRPHRGQLDERYLLHFLRRQEILQAGESMMTGSGGQRRVPPHFLRNLRIPLPPLPEQRRIAAILDKGIILQELTLKRKERTNSLLNQVFIKWFPKNQHLSAPLASLGTVTTGKTPPTNDATSFGGPIPFTTPGDLLEKTPARWLSEDGAQKSRVVRSGSALVCCIGATIGKVGIARQPTAFNQQINAVEWGDSIDDAYGYFALRARSRHIAALGESTTMPILNKGQFSKLTIPVPPISKQRKFREFFDTWEKQQTSHEAQLQTLEALARSLPSRAFRGEL